MWLHGFEGCRIYQGMLGRDKKQSLSLWSQWVRVYVHIVLIDWSCMFNALNDDLFLTPMMSFNVYTQRSGIRMNLEKNNTGKTVFSTGSNFLENLHFYGCLMNFVPPGKNDRFDANCMGATNSLTSSEWP